MARAGHVPSCAASLTNSIPGDDGGQEGGKEGGQQEGDAKQGRGKNMTFPELMYCMWAALGTNERFSAGAHTALRLSTFNFTRHKIGKGDKCHANTHHVRRRQSLNTHHVWCSQSLRVRRHRTREGGGD
jgi:hypothetical protein